MGYNTACVRKVAGGFVAYKLQYEKTKPIRGHKDKIRPLGSRQHHIMTTQYILGTTDRRSLSGVLTIPILYSHLSITARTRLTTSITSYPIRVRTLSGVTGVCSIAQITRVGRCTRYPVM